MKGSGAMRIGAYGFYFPLSLILLLCSPALSFGNDGWEGRMLSLTWENDAVDGTDRHYTQGAKIDYLSADNTLPRWLQSVSRVLPRIGYRMEAQKYGLGVGQDIYTPADLENPNPVLDDRPYAGWLYARMVLQRRGAGYGGFLTRENLALDLGVVGPESQGEQTQKEWHSRAPLGWSHQLRNEIAFALNYRRDYLIAFRTPEDRWGVDLIPHFGGSGGTVATFANLGATVRLGWHMPNEFGTDTKPPRWGAYLFSGVDGRAVLRNIFLDGNTFAHSQSVKKEPLVGDLLAGLTLVFKNLEVTVSHTFRTREFKDERSVDSWGTATLRLKF